MIACSLTFEFIHCRLLGVNLIKHRLIRHEIKRIYHFIPQPESAAAGGGAAASQAAAQAGCPSAATPLARTRTGSVAGAFSRSAETAAGEVG